MTSSMNSQKLFRLDGRVAFISAARGHLGRAMSRALAEAGAHLIVNGRDDAALAEFERDLKAEGFSVERAAFDATDSGAPRSSVTLGSSSLFSFMMLAPRAESARISRE